jgi:hypothetical protein
MRIVLNLLDMEPPYLLRKSCKLINDIKGTYRIIRHMHGYALDNLEAYLQPGMKGII